ncbi:MAG: DNA polymerase Y family protein [Pseudomonadota bacterium]
MPALWLCLSTPTLLLDTLASDAGDQPARALVEHHGPLRWVHSANREAREAGVRTGQAVSTALARVPHLQLIAHDADRERQQLEGLALWAWQFSSQLSLLPPTALLLEVGGSLKLFGDLDRLLAAVSSGLEALGYRHRCGLAPTPLAARLVARCGLPPVLDAAALNTVLSALPVQQLDLPTATLRALQQCGIRQTDALLAQPRDAIARRFDPACCDYLDRLRGQAADPRPRFAPPRRFDQRLDLLQDVDNTAALGFPLKRLIDTLSAQLTGRDCGVSSVQLTLGHPREPDSELQVRLLEASGDASHLLHVARTQLEQLHLPEPVRALRLRCDRFEAVARGGDDLFHHPGRSAVERRSVIEHLRARLGEAAVYQVETVDDNRPECAWRAHLNNPTSAQADPARWPPRPLWLIDPPEPAPAGLTLESGPERLESGWWGGQCQDGRAAPDMRRDYYIAHDSTGLRYWVFQRRDAPRDWYVHGRFG